MDYDAQLAHFCDPVLVAQVESFDPTVFTEESPLSAAMQSGGGRACAEAVVKYLTLRTGPHFSNRASQIYLSGVSNYHPTLVEPLRTDVTEAIKRLPYSKDIAFNIFTALRIHRIDIRDHFEGKILSDWNFKHPRAPDAERWQYNLYLAQFGDQQAVQALSDKIAATTYGNDVQILLDDLSNLHNQDAKRIFEAYRDDQRTGDAPNGPGATTAEFVALYLQLHDWSK
ncbi:hypothetical protein [uncultured Litoreibacter sp.]|uniref:hypothetical protein n=1 Tax=uncultured Litoreibacter sp. TaxID=1392394 RepID=UPI00260E161C|nr:hypothetical protein [uncultured Litoreibacter sp.]